MFDETSICMPSEGRHRRSRIPASLVWLLVDHVLNLEFDTVGKALWINMLFLVASSLRQLERPFIQLRAPRRLHDGRSRYYIPVVIDTPAWARRR